MCSRQNSSSCGSAGHAAVVVHDFADHAGGIEPGDARKIERSFRLPGAHQHAAAARAQRKDVTGARQVCRARGGVDGGQDGGGAIGGADAGGDAATRVDGFGESRAEGGGIHRGHGRQVQLVAALLGESQTDQAAAVLGHEVDGRGSYFFRRQGQVAFVLAVFVIDQNDLATLAKLLGGFIRGCKLDRHSVSGYCERLLTSVVATFCMAENGTTKPCSGAIVCTSRFNFWT